MDGRKDRPGQILVPGRHCDLVAVAKRLESGKAWPAARPYRAATRRSRPYLKQARPPPQGPEAACLPLGQHQGETR